jgi:hypothetical protein
MKCKILKQKYMIKVKLKSRITFDGELRKINDEIEMTEERFEQMNANFKAQKLEINNYLEVIKANAEPTIETPQRVKRTRKKNSGK